MPDLIGQGEEAVANDGRPDPCLGWLIRGRARRASDRKVRNMTVGMAAAFGAKRLDRAAAIRPDTAFYGRFERVQPASCQVPNIVQDSEGVCRDAEA